MLFSMRQIIHLDMDEFFAAVEKLDNPSLRGKCILVGGSVADRGVVSTASYEARQFGCRSAMAMAKAVRLCPHAIVLPGRHHRYAEISEQLHGILRRYSPLIEPLSIDEAFLDVTGCARLLGSAQTMAADMKRAIRDELHLTASVGVAPNKFLAKLASDLRKPDGLVVITPETMQATLDPLPIRRIWGVGPAGEAQFAKLNIRTIGQLRAAPLSTLQRAFGREAAEHFHRLSQGLDDRPVTPDGEAKSIGQEQTFAEDVTDLGQLRGVLLGQVEQVARRLRRHGLRARSLHLKLRYGDFTTITRAATLPRATDVTDELWRASVSLLEKWATDFRPLRLLGMTANGLTGQGGQLPLFEDPRHTKLRQLDRAIDDISSRFGPGALRRGGATPRDGEE